MSAISNFRNTIDAVNERASETLLGRIGLWGSARAIGIGVGILAWFALAQNFPRNLLPGPFETLGLTWALITSGSAWVHLSATFKGMTVAFLLALLLGGTLGLLMGLNSYATNFFTPYVNIGLSIPGLAWAATFFVIFNFQTLIGDIEMAPVFATMFTVAPYLAINIWKGIGGLDADLLDMAKAFEASPQRQIRHVVIPSIAQELFAAFRFGLAISWKVFTITEMFAAKSGIGYMVMAEYQVYRYEQAWAWAGAFMIFILLIEYGLFRPVERRVFEYRQDADLSLVGR